jgi:uncharacterized membrane protein
MSSLTPLVAVHLTSALLAVVTGPVALWARKGATQRPRLHRAFGYAWVTLMIIAAVSALFIPAVVMPIAFGMGPIHGLSFLTLGMLAVSFWFLAKGNIDGHRKTMQNLYLGACVIAGAFTLMPGRFLGNLVWGQWLGLISANHAPRGGQPIIGQILAGTPVWVWGLLVGLVALGLSQTRARKASLTRVVTLPVAMGGLSLYGTVSAFGSAPTVLLPWALAMGTVLAISLRQSAPAAARYNATRREFDLPGSWVPMVLILGIFLTKYAVGVATAMQPALRAEVAFALPVAVLYGVFSGLFAGRTLGLLRLARPQHATGALTLRTTA